MLPLPIWADDHILPLAELHEKARSASEDPAKNIKDIERILSYAAAAQAVEKSNVNQDQMRRAVASLSDDELARLANKARASEKDVQGGMNNSSKGAVPNVRPAIICSVTT